MRLVAQRVEFVRVEAGDTSQREAFPLQLLLLPDGGKKSLGILSPGSVLLRKKVNRSV